MHAPKPSIPNDLSEADKILHAYGQWAQDRFKKQRCASAEGAYKSPDFWNDGDPPLALVADFRAMDIHRALLLVPVRYRRILHAHYIPQRLPTDVQRRHMGIAPKTWDIDHIAGVRMFWNNWRLHISPKR